VKKRDYEKEIVRENVKERESMGENIGEKYERDYRYTDFVLNQHRLRLTEKISDFVYASI